MENQSEILQTFLNRRDRLRQSIIKNGLDALIILSPANRYYLSGFELHDAQFNESSGLLLITASGDDWLFTDSRYELAAKRLWPEKFIRIYKSDPIEDLLEIASRQAKIAGFEADSARWSLVRQLKTAKRTFKPVFKPVKGLVEQLRMIKDTLEVKALERSFFLNNKAISWLDNKIAGNELINTSETELAWEIERLFRENGASELAFSTIVASGSHAALPHAYPRRIAIKPDACLLVDLGCRVDDYCSDQTRTWWLGPTAPDYFQKTLALAKNAQEAAMSIMRPGIACSDVYKAARDVFKKAGVDDFFTHGLGHGVGLETHELPALSPRSDMKLESGMVVTVEPGLYYPEWGGIRWEYTVLVEENGIRKL